MSLLLCEYQGYNNFKERYNPNYLAADMSATHVRNMAGDSTKRILTLCKLKTANS